MEYMGLALFIKYGTPVLLFALIIISVYLTIITRSLSVTIADLKKEIVWRETFHEREKSVNIQITALENRVKRIEDKIFNGR